MSDAVGLIVEVIAILVLLLWWDRRKHRRRPKQTTFVYCPTCGMEQIATGCFVEDTDLVTYRCRACGTVTRWDFDAPAPLLLFVNGEMMP